MHLLNISSRCYTRFMTLFGLANLADELTTFALLDLIFVVAAPASKDDCESHIDIRVVSSFPLTSSKLRKNQIVAVLWIILESDLRIIHKCF